VSFPDSELLIEVGLFVVAGWGLADSVLLLLGWKVSAINGQMSGCVSIANTTPVFRAMFVTMSKYFAVATNEVVGDGELSREGGGR
jgi:hypothetical protein